MANLYNKDRESHDQIISPKEEAAFLKGVNSVVESPFTKFFTQIKGKKDEKISHF